MHVSILTAFASTYFKFKLNFYWFLIRTNNIFSNSFYWSFFFRELICQIHKRRASSEMYRKIYEKIFGHENAKEIKNEWTLRFFFVYFRFTEMTPVPFRFYYVCLVIQAALRTWTSDQIIDNVVNCQCQSKWNRLPMS